MRILISGSRDMPENQESKNLVCQAIVDAMGTGDFYWDDITVITGGAKGADTVAHDLARGLGAKTVVIMADWKRHGNGAGPIRNGKMLDLQPDLVIGFTLGKSVGTRNCLKQAKMRGIDTIQIPVPV